MNKITVVKEKILTELDQTESRVVYNDYTLVITKDTSLVLDFDHSKVDFKIVVEPNTKLKLISKNKESKNKVYFEIKENAILDKIHLGYNCSDEISVYLDGENAKVSYRYSTINSKKNSHKLSIYHNKSNTESNVVNHGVNFSRDLLSFEVNGIVLKESFDCICNQDNKIISMFNNTARIDPNLLIDNHDVEASHAAFIGRLNDDELFYLMTRGISKENSYKLLLEGFLLVKEELDKETKDWFFGYLKNRR